MLNWRLSSFYFIYFCVLGVVVPYWGLFLQYKAFNATQIGQLMAILLLTKMVAPNVWATIADNVAIKKGSSLGIVKLATGLAFSLYCLLFFANSFWFIAFAMCGYSVFWNACLPQMEAATLNVLAQNKHQYGMIRLWGSLGFIFTTLLVGKLIDHFSAAVIMPVGAVCLFLLFIASFWIVNSQHLKNTKVDHQQKVPIYKLINSSVVVLLIMGFVMQLSHAPLYTFFSIYLEEHGYSKTHIGWLWSTGVIFEIIIFLVSYKLFKRFHLSSLFIFTFLTAGVRWCIIAIYPEKPVIILLSQIMHAITYGLYHGVMMQFIDYYFKGRYQIRGQALYSSVTFGLGGTVGCVISGYVWTNYGHQTLFLWTGWLMLFATFLSLFFVKKINHVIVPAHN